MYVYIIIILIIVIIVYYRICNRFWSIQPVYHYYSFFQSEGIINKELPNKNRYTNFKNIITYKFEDISENDLNEYIALIQSHYLNENENKYEPKKDNIVPYFKSHNHPTFITLYYQINSVYDTKKLRFVDHKNIVGGITGRPLHVYKNNTHFEVYYVDYLCVHKYYRKRGMAPQLIQTHEYNQSYNNRKIAISLFKREDELTSIIPLCCYKSYCFDMKKLNVEPIDACYKILIGDNQNIYYFYNFLKQSIKENKWIISIFPDMANFMELVKMGNIFLTMVLQNNDILAAYVYRKTCTYISKEAECIDLIGSIRGQIDIRDFQKCEKVGLHEILKKHSSFQYLIIEDISDNGYIIDDMKPIYPIAISPTAYYFYNFAHKTVEPHKLLIIN
jgi:Myristoyl-CoA:protein N-myristoyltransferase, N-terminal domain